MSTKQFVVLALWIVAVVLFALVALAAGIVASLLLAAAASRTTCCAWAGMALNTFWSSGG